jgi:hypothetical protein
VVNDGGDWVQGAEWWVVGGSKLPGESWSKLQQSKAFGF